MRIPFCETLTDPDTGKEVLYDIEGVAEVSLDFDVWGNPLVSVDAIYVNGVDLFRSYLSAFRHIAALLADRIEDDSEVLERLEQEAREAA